MCLAEVVLRKRLQPLCTTGTSSLRTLFEVNELIYTRTSEFCQIVWCVHESRPSRFCFRVAKTQAQKKGDCLSRNHPSPNQIRDDLLWHHHRASSNHRPGAQRERQTLRCVFIHRFLQV